MFIEEAFQKGIDLWVSEGKLRYRAPKGAFTPEFKEKLGQQKDKILSLVTPPYVAEEGTAIFLYPLSYAQKTFWFLYQLAPESAAYNMPFAVRICSRLDVAAFQKTLQALIGRHHSFRTTYTAIEGAPVQLLHEHYPLPCEVIDAATWSREELHKRLRDEARRPFDLERGPVLRAQLFSLAGDDHIFLLTVHHIALDLWSLEVIIDELGKLYTAQITGTRPSLPPLEFQYKDFVRWQLQMLAGPRGDQLRIFWQEQLTGELPVLNLPTDRARPAVQTYNTGIVPFMSGKEFSQQLKAFASAENVSLYSVLLAAFFVLLHRYTAQDDILVGAPTSGRSKTEFQHIAGYFVNPIVLRANLEGNPSWREFLQKVQQIVLRGFDHQDYPSHLLPEELHLDHDPGHPQLFQTIFMFQELHRLRQASSLMTGKPGQQITIGGLAMEPVDVGEETIIFVDLLLMMYEENEQIVSSWQYNSDLFDAETIERMAEHFNTLLKGMLANPEIPISELPLLTEAERHKLLVEWTDTKVEYPDYTCIHQMFEKQAAHTPDAAALVFTSLESGARIALTYQELNQKANQLAHYLRSLNVGAEVLVGVCMERSIEMVIALLGILKAGGAYLPLDPAYPADRLQYMFEDSQIPVLLTQQQLLERLPAHKAHTISLDTEWEQIADHSAENPEPQTVVDNLAYMIYTSGSTGKPKGVMLSHRGLLNLCEVQKRAFRKTPESRVLQFASFSFDASVSEVFVTFLAGATLHIAPQNDLMPGPPLSQTLRQNKISVVTLPPSVLSAMEQEKFPDLKTIVSAGEACSAELVKRWQPGRVFLNAYGPTEGTVCATMNEQIRPETASSIGKAIANTQIYILDRYLNPVPVGVPGELCFGGISLARGYRNRPELTAEKFIPHPFSDEPGARLYRTGDLARYLPDGNLEFLGRIDHQLKIRGYRIELGEIEAILASHPGVLDSVVLARKSVAGENRLTAYVIPDLNALQAHSAGPQLKKFLRKQLPEYMVPAFFVLLDKFPLTPNGKVDRRALPEPEKVRPEISQVFEAPRTPVEERLVDMWSEILGVEQIGIHDNFFDLGGNSLVVIQLVSRLRDTFQIEIPLFKLFEIRTIEDLAFVVEELPASGKIQPVTETQVIHRRPEEGPYPLSFAQQRLWFFDQLEPGSAVYNLYSVTRITGSLNVNALEQSVNEIIRRHASLRTKFEAIDGQPAQVIIPHLTIALSVKDLQHVVKEEQEATIHHVALEETQKPFNLSECPLFRAVLLKLAPQEHVIITTTHHIISDDWSGGVFMLELAALYAAFSTGQSSPLPELPVQYTDFALWQREFLQGEVLARQLFYWKQQLSGDLKDLQGPGKPVGSGLPVLQLPTDRPRPVKQTFPGNTQSFVLSKRLSDSLKNLSQQEGCTLFMTLFAGFNTLLYRYTGQEDIIIGAPFANRNRTEIENLIGFFVNTVVLRTDLSGNPSFRELLRQVKEVTLEAQVNQDIPFDKIVAEVHPDRELNRQPLFQIMFVLQNAPMRDIQLSGLTMTPIEIHNDTSMFDLTLEMVDLDTGLSGIIEYNTDLFDAATIRRMIEHFQVFLEGIAVNPEQQIAELPVMQTAEQNQILVEWNDTEAAYPQDVCIHELFEAQVNKTPDALAVVFEKRQLTYRDLNRRANQLAHYLRKLRVTPETPVGICVSRSLEMIAGILGILKAGGAYVPIDPSYPRERMNFIIDDAHISVLLSQQDLREKFSGDGLHIVCLDTDWHTIAQESHRDPDNPAFSENPGYVIYTSGSTGIPKGVIVSHQALVNRSTAIVKRYALQPDERVLQFASISFDVSLEEIFPSLISGATIVLRPGEAAMSFSDLLAFLHQEKVSVANLPTSYWHEWVTELSRSKISLPSALRLVIVGTEQALLERLVQWRALVGDRIRWINGYGPTEATITATMYEPQGKQRLTSIPIGLPIENTQVYLLDKYLQPVPIGVSGELYIGGESLARGYLQRAELTAEKFVPNPFSRAPGGRLYRTGDLARFLPDGNIEFLGRVDHQVKIRGFRIELGEIEVRLKQHPAVREAVVTVREESPGHNRLIAYCLFQEEHTATVNELRDFLKNQLPEYMLPAMFIILEELPLTPSGKIDRRALPEPDAERFGFSPETFVAPRTRNEKTLADIWAELLGLQQIGIHDNFFELGGDSILSLQIIARAHQAGLQIKPEQLFQYQTIAELAVAAETTTTIQAEQDLVTGLVPLTPIQFWFFEQELPEPYHWNQSLLLEVHRELQPELLEKAFQHLIRHHDALRLRFIREEHGWNQECSVLHEIPLVSQIDVASLPEAEQRKAIEEKSATFQHSLNISEGPLLRAALFQRGSVKPNCLFLVIHHLAVDGVSWRIVLEDLQTAYAQLLEGRQVRLSLKTTSFKSWAERLTEYAGITRLQDEIPYWTDESRSQIVSLPRDDPEGSNTEASAQTISYTLNAEETRQLLNEVPQAYNTQINDVLLTALARSVSIWSGAQAVLIELEGHGREPLFEDVDLSRTVGWFTTAFPVLLDIGEVFSSGEALKSIKEQLRRIPNRGIGYGILRYLSQDPAIRSMLAALPQPEISFNYLGRLDQILSESKFFTLAEENRGPEHSPLGKRSHLLEVNGFVMAGKLEVHWTYSENIYQRATIERVAREFMNALRSLIQHCVSPKAGGYTPSDFPDVGLSQDDLDQILADISDIED